MSMPEPKAAVRFRKQTLRKTIEQTAHVAQTPHLQIYPGMKIQLEVEELRDPVVLIPVKNVMTRQINEPAADRPGVIELEVLRKPDLGVGTFAYAMYDRELDDFAVGDSPPRMTLKKNPDD